MFPTDKPGSCHAESNPDLFDKNLFGFEAQVAQVESYSGLRTNKGFDQTIYSLVKKVTNPPSCDNLPRLFGTLLCTHICPTHSGHL